MYGGFPSIEPPWCRETLVSRIATRLIAVVFGSTLTHGCTLRKLCFHFLSHWMGYDRGDSFPFGFEPNGVPFGLKSKEKPSPRSYPILCERKWKFSFLSVLPRVGVLPKTTAIRRAAVRETSVSRHHGGPIEGPPETRRTSLHYRIEWFKGDLWKWKYSFLSVLDQRRSNFNLKSQGELLFTAGGLPFGIIIEYIFISFMCLGLRYNCCCGTIGSFDIWYFYFIFYFLIASLLWQWSIWNWTRG